MSHSVNPGYIKNNHWCVCSVCGFEYRRSEMRTTWDGKDVCVKDFETRHPQELLRGRKDNMTPIGITTGSEDTSNRTGQTYLNITDDEIPSGTFSTDIL